MADFLATIELAPGQTVWPADEVPHLTDDALYRFDPEPDPTVTKGELRRFTSADLHNSRAGRALSARELLQFARKCKAAGLPGLPDELTYSKWGEYLEAFNQDAESRGWWAGLIQPEDLHQAERLSWVMAAEVHVGGEERPLPVRPDWSLRPSLVSGDRPGNDVDFAVCTIANEEHWIRPARSIWRSKRCRPS